MLCGAAHRGVLAFPPFWRRVLPGSPWPTGSLAPKNGERDGVGPVADDDGRPGMIVRRADRGGQVGTASNVERSCRPEQERAPREYGSQSHNGQQLFHVCFVDERGRRSLRIDPYGGAVPK